MSDMAGKSGSGKILALASAVQTPVDPEVIEAAVSDWLDDHPEAVAPIDDTAGEGDTDKLWSADKTAGEVASLTEAIVPLQEEVNNLDVAVFSASSGKVVAPDLFQNVTDTDMLLAIGETEFSSSSGAYGFYVDVSEYHGQEMMIVRANMGATLRGVFCHDIPAVGVTYASSDKWIADYSDKHSVIVTVPNNSNIKYMYVMYYSSSSDTMTKQQALEGMKVFQPEAKNLYSKASEEKMFSFEGTFQAASSLYGFYVPIDDPACQQVYVSRTYSGKRFRFAFSSAIPDIGVAYSGYDAGHDALSYATLAVPSGAKYLYIAFYSSTQDSRTKEQLLDGMTIRQCVPAMIESAKKVDRIERLDHDTGIQFENGSVNSSGVFSTDSKHITSDFVKVDGDFLVSCPDDYVMNIHLFDEQKTYVSTTEKTDGVYRLSHGGYARFTIEASDESDITPDTVDFSQIKMPVNRFSALNYTSDKTFVLDAENSKTADVYAYYDEAIASHSMYASKTFLCNDESGLPINYYTFGSGAKKLCIVTGQHGPDLGYGDPRDSVITVAKMMHDIVTGEFAHGSFLQKLHDEYTILVFPVFNPYGFDNHKRTNPNNVDTNRDWEDESTNAVSNAKPVIATFAPDIGLDVHCNGSTMLDIPNIGIEVQFGENNTAFINAVNGLFNSYYNTNANKRDSTHDTTRLANYFQDTLQISGGLIEMRWWLTDRKAMHDSQVESINYAMIVNAIKYFDAIENSGTYTWEKTPNQNQY